MARRFLAFRMLGEFDWPPLPGAKKVAPAVGAVEVFFIPSPKSGKYFACARWTPKSSFPNGVTPKAPIWSDSTEPFPQNTIYDLNKNELKALVGDGSAPFIFRFGSADTNLKGVRLAFAGGMLFEQFAVPSTLGEAEPPTAEDLRLDLRIPLVRHVTGGDDKKIVLSAMEFGQPDNTGVRVVLGIPLAMPLGMPGVKGGMAEVLACSALCTGSSLVLDEPSELAGRPLSFDMLLLGRKKYDAEAGTGRVHIGEALFARAADPAPPYKIANPTGLWPGKSNVAETLGYLGLTVSKSVASSLTLREDASSFLVPTSAGLRPITGATEGEGPRFEVLGRLRLSIDDAKAADAMAGVDDDIRVKIGKAPRENTIQIRRRRGQDDWIDVGSQLNILADYSGSVAHADVWSSERQLRRRVTLAWKLDFPKDPDRWPAPLRAARLQMQGALSGLRLIEGSQPAALFPEMTGIADRSIAFAAAQAVDRVIAVRDGTPVQNPISRPEVFEGTLLDQDRVPVDSSGRAPDSGASAHKPPTIRLLFPHFDRRGARAATTFVAELLPDPDIASGPGEGGELELSIALSGVSGAAELCSISGIAFEHVELAPVSTAGVGNSVLKIWPVRGGDDWRQISFTARFEIQSTFPFAIDRPRDDRSGRATPTMLNETEPRPGRYSLTGTETLSPHEDRRLTAQLSEYVERDDRTGSFILLSEEPFALKRSMAQPLSARGDDQTVDVAEYDSDTRQWQARLVTRAYRYVLPPQAIGEGMDKPRRLELHDQHPKAMDASGVVEQRLAVPFRLTPPAEIWVRPTDVERRFAPPEWAASDIFRQRGELGLGAALHGARGEFVYGLAFGLDVAREVGPSRAARVTEIDALMGRPFEGAQNNRDERWKGWQTVLRAYATRPERLEIWANDPTSTTPFAPARFSAGVRFALRHTALHRHPISDDIKVPFEPARPRFHRHGLPGGALWPIESRNVLEMVVRDPHASGGSIERIAFSPLGGDADQTARFANNRAAIITETRGGYVQRQKVEVIGRIGIFWHRAKHVILYERTVNPSAQFAPLSTEKDQDNQVTRTRRPVLRKVREYIEILQPERRYPDVGSASAGTNAMLAAVRFNSRIIPVDSGWGEDVRDIGFMVPLWNRHAARVRPQVYVRPDIAYVTHAEGAVERPEGAQECLNPDNLYFFADTTKDVTDDTDAWPARLAIDSTNLPPPCHNWSRVRGGQSYDGAVEDSALRVPRGFARFTWRLAPPTARSAINAGRGDKPVYAALETLTFARGIGAAAAEDKLRKVIDFQSEIVGAVFNGVWTRDGAPIAGDEDAFLPDLAGAIRGVLDILPRDAPIELPTDPSPLEEAVANLRTKLRTGPGSAFAKLTGQLSDAGSKADELLVGVASAPCEALKSDLIAKIDARKLALRREIRGWEESILRQLEKAGSATDELVADFGSSEAIVAFLTAELETLVTPVLQGATGEIGRLQSGIETARAAIDDVKGDAKAALIQLKADITAVRRATEEGKPWSQPRVERFHAQLDVEVERARKRLAAMVTDAQRRMTSELDEISQVVAGAGVQALTSVASVTTELGAEFKPFVQWRGQLRKFSDQYSGYVKGAGKLVADAGAVLDKARAKDEYGAFIGKADAFLLALGTVVEMGGEAELSRLVGRLERFELEFKPQATDLSDKIALFIETTGNGVLEVLTALKTVVDDSGDGLKQELTEALGALTSDIEVELADAIDPFAKKFSALGTWVDYVAGRQFAAADAFAVRLGRGIDAAASFVDEAAKAMLDRTGAAIEELEPARLSPTIVGALLDIAAVKTAIGRAAATVAVAGNEGADTVLAVRMSVALLVEELDHQLENLGEAVLGKLTAFEDVCNAVSDKISGLIVELTDGLAANIDELEQYFVSQIGDIFSDVDKFREFHRKFGEFEGDAREVANRLAQSAHRIEAWGDRALGAIENIGKGGLSTAPSNILRALAAIGSGPELPNLEFAAERIGYYYGLVDDLVDTTPVEAWFGKLGDGLKAMGVSLPFSQIGNRLIPPDLSDFDINRVFGGFAGIDLSRLFGGVKLPQGARDAIKITHDFDRKTYRAWVQIDVAVDVPGRNPMISFGPFNLETVNAKLLGFVRLEASKDTDTVEQSGQASLKTDLDAVVAGQSMVKLREVEIRYGKSGGLEVDFDPKKLQLNPSFQFIQNTLQSIFGDEFGGMEIIKNDGVPIGLRHSFAMPPLSLTFGTSGVQNIQLSNNFELTAFPDFVIANRFALARPDLPFIFTIFIIGGTGWLTVDLEYRPFEGRGELTVDVEAAAGGAASLAFAFAGVTGSVFITVSVALRYRKLIGQSGGGLTVSLVVVITGLVDVLRIVSAMITVILRLSYFENGDIDAVGSFRITIRISRFFKISAGGQARYRMTGGKSQTSSTSSVDYEVTDKNLAKAKKLLEKKAA